MGCFRPEPRSIKTASCGKRKEQFCSSRQRSKSLHIEKKNMQVYLFGDVAIVTYIKEYRQTPDTSQFFDEDDTDVFKRSAKGWLVQFSKISPAPKTPAGYSKQKSALRLIETYQRGKIGLPRRVNRYKILPFKFSLHPGGEPTPIGSPSVFFTPSAFYYCASADISAGRSLTPSSHFFPSTSSLNFCSSGSEMKLKRLTDCAISPRNLVKASRHRSLRLTMCFRQGIKQTQATVQS